MSWFGSFFWRKPAHIPEISELIELEARDGHRWRKFEKDLEHIDFESRSMQTQGRTSLIDLWEREFVFRGLGPLEARTKAERELRVVQSLRQALLAYKNYLREINSIVSNESFYKLQKIRTLRNRISILIVVSGLILYILEKIRFVYLLAILLFVVFLLAFFYKSYINRMNINSISSKNLARIHGPIESKIAFKMKTISQDLVDFGRSELFDDSDMRQLILDWAERT